MPVDDIALPEVHAVFNSEHYAGGDMSESEFALLDANCRVRRRVLAAPNLLVLLDVRVEEGGWRIRGRGRSEERAINCVYLEGMDARYRALSRRGPRVPVLHFDSVRHDLRDGRGRALLVSAVRAALRSAA